MKMDKVAGSGNDEFYTPVYAILPIVGYLKEKGFKKVWCPFDTCESNFVKILHKEGFEVLYSHIDRGFDFFKIEAPDCDVIVSNPPYSKKTEVIGRLVSIQKPFAMLVGVVGLFESQKRFELFKNNKVEILYFNRRISYMKSYDSDKTELNPPFSSVYLCKDVLPEQMCFDYINKK